MSGSSQVPTSSQSTSPAPLPKPSSSLFSRFYNWVAQTIDQKIGWDKLPLPFGLAVLAGLRFILRERNLYDTATTIPSTEQPTADGRGVRYLVARTPDGTFNDLGQPLMGRANSRFGRNVPFEDAHADEKAVLSPNPRIVSRELLARDTFIPATFLNLLAAAWVQFMIHDWFSHGKNQKQNPWQVPLNDNDPWPIHPMTILRTQSDPTRPAGTEQDPPTFINTATHWWDGSQIYGSDAATMARVRSGVGGKLNIGADGLLPIDPTLGVDLTGVNGNWWIGLSLLHTLFTKEHNSICDRLRAEYPSWSDDDLFDHARLINVAVMAKIHTINWTPAILNNPTLQVSMNANWWGLASEQVYRLFGRISSNEIVSGIPGGPKDFFGVPFSLTEEFVSVYRMHPLLPDEFRFRSVTGDTFLQERTLDKVADKNARELAEQVSMTDIIYSFGTSNPGAITLHNYPHHLRHRTEPDGSLIDLATTEIIRDRERGVPRYNEFRQLVHKTPVNSFEELTNNKVWQEELRRIYDNDINRVDLMVGMYAENPPQGFGFSDTAFRIFILMASRRLESDRFFTTDYTPAVYTQTGLDWILNNDMTTVLIRHHPALAPFLHAVKNPFAPWPNAKG